jgi:hypothetical protein
VLWTCRISTFDPSRSAAGLPVTAGRARSADTRARCESIRQLAGLRSRLAAAEDALADAPQTIRTWIEIIR